MFYNLLSFSDEIPIFHFISVISTMPLNYRSYLVQKQNLELINGCCQDKYYRKTEKKLITTNELLVKYQKNFGSFTSMFLKRST